MKEAELALETGCWPAGELGSTADKQIKQPSKANEECQPLNANNCTTSEWKTIIYKSGEGSKRTCERANDLAAREHG